MAVEVIKIARRLRTNDSFLLIITADGEGTGWGKSSLAQWIAHLVDKEWNHNRVAFHGRSFVEKCLEAPPGSFIVWDEVGDGANRRRAMSRANVDTMNFFTRWRERNVAGAMCYPHIGYLDEAHLDYCSAWVNIDKKKEHAVWRTISHRTTWGSDGKPKKIVSFSPGHGFTFPNMAKSPTWPAYRVDKKAWLDHSNNRGKKPVPEAVSTSPPAHVQPAVAAPVPKLRGFAAGKGRNTYRDPVTHKFIKRPTGVEA